MHIRAWFAAAATLVASFLFAVLAIVPAAHAAGRTIDFSGHTWSVKSGLYGPGPNYWTDNSQDVFVDTNGALHMKIVQRDGAWRSSEVWLPTSLGFGTYEFDIASRVDQLDPQVVAAPFLYQDDTHEIDIEYSRWGYPDNQNTWYNIQPWTTKGNQAKFMTTQGTGPITARIVWSPEKIILSTMQNGVALNSWTYTGANNFEPGGERVHINFWMYEAKPPQSGATQELVINAFRFSPQQIQPQLIIEPIAHVNKSWLRHEIKKQKIRIQKMRRKIN